MKELVKQLIPRKVWEWARHRRSVFQLYSESAQDRRRYAQFAALDGQSLTNLSRRQVEAQVTKGYHAIEKAFSLPDPRRPFGATAAAGLDALLKTPASAEGEVWAGIAQDALEARYRWNEHGETVEIVSPLGVTTQASDFNVGRDFFHSRRSVRNFSAEPVSDDQLQRAVEMASAAPSVCNRAPWNVRFYRDEDVARVLSYQNGNRGFTDVIPVIAVISVDSALFTGVIERYQPWIEGGIFASTLLWALHAVGLQSCMLNLSLVNARAEGLRKTTGMSGSELPVVMIAIGHAAEGHRVARSRRRDVDEIIDDDK